MKESGARVDGYLYVDKRLQEIKKRHAGNLLTHVNPYTGKSYGEEENIAVYEIFNERDLSMAASPQDFSK